MTTPLQALRLRQLSRPCTRFLSSSSAINFATPRLLSPRTPPRPPRSAPLPLLRHGSTSAKAPTTSPPKPVKNYTFAEIQTLSASLSSKAAPSPPSRLLIDVREPPELASSGHIPGAVNLPLSVIGAERSALVMEKAKFEEEFGFARPSPGKQEVVFYCKAGVRSGKAAERAQREGYENVAEYKGSWDGWVAGGGKVAR